MHAHAHAHINTYVYIYIHIQKVEFCPQWHSIQLDYFNWTMNIYIYIIYCTIIVDYSTMHAHAHI